MTLTYEQVSELLPAYAIGALETEERSAIEEYLHQQKQLLSRLAAAEGAATLIAQSADQTPIAPDAKKRLMRRIQADVPEVFQQGKGAPRKNSMAETLIAPNQLSPEPQRLTTSNQTPSPAHAKPRGMPLTNRPERRMSAPSTIHAQQVPISRQHRGKPPGYRVTAEDLFPQEKKRPNGFFNTRVMLNAATIASLITLLFVGLINYSIEQDLRRVAVELEETKSDLSQSQEMLVGMNEANAVLVDQYGQFIGEQSRLTASQESIKLENEQLTTQQKSLADEVEELAAQNRKLAIERADLFEENTRLSTQLQARDERITLVGAATKAVVMFGTEAAPGLQGTLFQQEGEAALVVHGLKPLPSEETYQFWLVAEDGTQIPAGLFQVDEKQDPTWANLSIPFGITDYKAVGISIEPASGSQSPTGPMLLESPVVEENANEVG